MRPVRPRVLALVVVVLAGLGAVPGIAAAQEFAPVDVAGPPLSVTDAELAAALGCSGDLAGAKVTPVLLVQGTGATAKDNWSWTYEPALSRLGIPWCHVDLPDHATGDVQRNGEYVVAAIRAMHARAGRRISIIGHSQGGMVPRWALRFWPDTRAMVDDLVGFAPSNHGTTVASCTPQDPCSAAGWQQSDESAFMRALNSRSETFAGISYTNIVTRTDETVQPNESSFLRTGDGRITNVATQDLCPAAAYEHLLIGLIDPVAYALAIDALTHDGPADRSRIGGEVCLQVLHPGIDPVTGPIAGAEAARSYASYQARTVPAEPPLACYTTASCPAGARTDGGIVPARLAPAARRTCTKRSRFTVTLRRLRGARATLGGRRVKVRRTSGGRIAVRVDLRRSGTKRVTLRVRGRDARGRSVTVVRLYRRCAS